jgi:deoxyribose-phosphate aldolase
VTDASTMKQAAVAKDHGLERNPGMKYTSELFNSLRINRIETAARELQGTGIPVAAVSTGFPAGQIPLSLKLAQVQASVEAGASEVDIIISRAKVLTGSYSARHRHPMS